MQSSDDRQIIIDAAYSCLSEPHSGPVPVAAILERSGLSTRAFYRHFVSKDELFLAMLRQEADALADRLDRIAERLPGAPREQLTAWVEMMFALALEPELRMPPSRRSVMSTNTSPGSTQRSQGRKSAVRMGRC